MKSFTTPNTALVLLGISLTSPLAFATPTLTKLHDFFVQPVTIEIQNPPPGTANPFDSAVMIGNDLWFTSQKGGLLDVGTISSFNLTTNATTVQFSLSGGPDGTGPTGTPTQSGSLLYYTTVTGGSGNRGVLSAYDTVAHTNTVLWAALPGTPAVNAINPGTLQGNVAVINRGETFGKDIYFLTANGGPGGAAAGAILRYQTSDSSVTQVYAFGAIPDGRQPFKGFTVVGTKLYFTTFTGGIAGTGTGNGAGSINELDVTSRGSEIYRKLANMPLGDGSTRLPAHNPYYRAADNSLYFTTTGTAAQPGSLQKYDLTTNALTTLHELQDTASGGVAFPQGKFAYGSVSEWNRALYFTTMQGGTTNGGTINRFNLDTGTLDVLFNLTGTAGNNFGGTVRGGFTFNGSTTTPAFYLLTQKGGANNIGTVLRLDLDPALPATPYENWAASTSGLTGTSAVPNADPDQDGLTNSVEFAFGTSPDSGAGCTLSTATQSAEGLEIRWTARTDGSVNYIVAGSSTIGAAPSPWTPVSAIPAAMGSPDFVVPTGYERRHVIIPTAEAKGFFRVQATFQTGAKP